MNELMTALTDWLLAGLSFALAIRSREERKLFYVSLGFASLLGGWVHFEVSHGREADAVWRLSTAAIAGILLAMWRAGLRDGRWSERVLLIVGLFSSLQAVGFLATCLFRPISFVVVILNYLPATVFAFVSFLRSPRGNAKWGAAGIAVSWAAAVAQASHRSPWPTVFDHNSIYHVIQMGGVLLLARAWRPDLSSK